MNINFLPQQRPAQAVSPDQMLRQEALAKALREKATASRQIEHPLQGVAQLGEAVVSGLYGQKVDAERKATQDFLGEVLMGANSGQPISSEKLAQLYALNPELGSKITADMSAREKAAAEAAQAAQLKAAQRDWVAQNAPDKLPAFDSGIVTADDIYAAMTASSDPFTLGKGEARYSGDGSVLAQNASDGVDPAVRAAQAEWVKQFAPDQLDAFNAGAVDAETIYKSLNEKKTPLIVNNQAVDPNTMSVVGDFRDTPKWEPPKVETIFDPETGTERKGYFVDGPNGQPVFVPEGGVAAPDSSLVTVNTGDNSSAFQKKADETAAVRFNEIVTEGSNAQQFLGDMQTLAEIGKNINTGKGAEIMNALGPYAEAVGVKIDGLGEVQAYKSIVDRLAPRMRAPGSGASSDRDVSMFLSSLPGLGRTPEGNQIIIETFRAIQQSKIAAAEIASKALAGEITWQEADAQIRQIGNPYEAFNAYAKNAGGMATQAGPQPGMVEDGYRFNGGDPADQNNWEQVQ